MQRLTSMFFFTCLTMTVFGCGGVEELPPTEGGTNVATQEEIDKQMKEAMKKGAEAYKEKGGKAP